MIRREWLKHAVGSVIVAGVCNHDRLIGAVSPIPALVPIFALRNAGCLCCIGWADHLRERGFEVHLNESQDLDAVKRRFGIPVELQSCHTAVAEGYLVEGHVPGEWIHKLLDETPEITGIAVPGMPIGSPGMEGPNPQSYDVIAFGATMQPERYVFGTVTPDENA